MYDECDYDGDNSLSLARALDEIGLNEITVKTRRETSLLNETMMYLYCFISDKRVTPYVFGSQSEGTTTPGIDSDTDSLTCFEEYIVIKEISEWTPGKINLLMLQENTAPGYCRLQLLRSDKPEPDVTLHGNVKLMNSSFYHEIKDPNEKFEVNGPARTFSTSSTNLDIVFALRCTSRLRVADTWARRQRRGDWPQQDLIKKVVKEPAFVVAVGHKLSEAPGLEWRISTSLAERCLMFDLNIVQIKCYVVLKMLLGEFVTPFVGKCLSSYHCKTALLYCMENTVTNFWREDNLMNCLTRCLETLYAWVSEENCPHYIVADVNLFDGKLTSLNKSMLLNRLTFLIKHLRHCLQKVRSDKLGKVFTRKLGTVSKGPILDSEATVLILGECELSKHAQFPGSLLLVDLPGVWCTRTPNTLVRYIEKTIHGLRCRKSYASTLGINAIERLLSFLSRLYGSLLASSAIARNDKIDQVAIELLETQTTHEISSQLKLASVFYCSGDLGKAELLLQRIEHHINNYDIQTVCECTLMDNDIKSQFCHSLYRTEDEKTRDGMFAHCVKFIFNEIHCVPHALRYELYKVENSDFQRKNLGADAWLALAVVDCLPLLYFLKYLTYRQLDKTGSLKEALRHLDQCIKEGSDTLHHADTAFNLLGQCYEMEQHFDPALVCYMRSLNIRSRHNAANWLIPALLNKCIQQRRVDK